MTNHSRLFLDALEVRERGRPVPASAAWVLPDGSEVLPLFEGRCVQQFDHAAKRYLGGRGRAARWELQPFGAKRVEPQFYVRRLSMLRTLGAVASGGSVELTLVRPDGRQQRITVEGGSFDIERKLRRSPASHGGVVRYLSRVDTNYWMESLPDHRAIYFQFNQVRDDDDESIAAFADLKILIMILQALSILMVILLQRQISFQTIFIINLLKEAFLKENLNQTRFVRF